MDENLESSTFHSLDADPSQVSTFKGLDTAPTSGFAFTPISPFRGRATSSNPAISAATTAVQASTDESQSHSDSSTGTDSSSAQSSAEESSASEDSAAEGSAAEGGDARDSEANSSDIENFIRDIQDVNVEGGLGGGDGDSDDDSDVDGDDDADSDDIDGRLVFESDHEPSPEYDRVPNHGFGHQTDKELEPAQILSDIVVPRVVGDLGVNTQPAATPTSMATTIAVAAPPSTVPTKRKAGARGGEWGESRRKRFSDAMKQRWANGSMSHVRDILRQNSALRLQAKKAEKGALDTPAGHSSESEAQAREGVLDTPARHPPASKAKSQEGALDKSAGYKSIDIVASGRAYREWEENGVPPSYRMGTNSEMVMPKGRGAIVVSMEKTSASLDDTMELDKVPPATSSSVPVGDRASMWAYLEPLLAKHRGQEMPHNGYVWELSILPRVRDLNINFEWQQTHPFMDGHPRDVSAVIIQLTGEPAATPCKRCKEGRGPWKGCIMICSKAADRPLANIFSCANCFYHFGQTYCSHKSWGAERSQRILRTRGKTIDSIQYSNQYSNSGQSKPHTRTSKPLAGYTPELQGESTRATTHDQDETFLQEYDDDKPESENRPLPSNNDQRDYEPAKSTIPLTDDQKALWNYIKPHLAFTTEVPEVGYIKELLSLPRVRDLVLTPNEPFAEKHTRDIAALIIQVTGDVLEMPCTRCRREKGPLFKGGCVAIKTDAHPEARRVYQSCANCTYDSKGGACSRGKGIPNRPQPPFPKKVPGITKSTDGVWLFRGGGGGLPRHTTATAAPRPQRQAALAAAAATTSLISAGEVQSAELFDMEVWEMAPGRVLKSNTDKLISFAYSKAFLSAGHTIPVCNDVQVQVKTINTGQTITMEPDDGQTRLVWIATGKVRVKLGDEPELIIGQHGMFRIEPGMACTIENRVYVDVTLHVTHLSGYF
ncbi:hypothetical protein B0H65DRAFT_432340 [Neurospora tetraspora]|uniref:Uncharacterized protein n=1 Tax=Neurospora tetraspora TaxID=94610 RepID=A0AAE0J9J7_9PEZI|nr:hypothetical protein B0H65DRAFT_432340 [Neurospora tetraspora]